MRDLEVNPLIQTCADIARAGIKNSQELYPKYGNSKLTHLGNYLLNAELPTKFALKHRDLGCKGLYRDDEVAIIFRPSTLCYLALIEAIEREFQVYLVHIDLGQASYPETSQVYDAIQSGWKAATNTKHDRYGDNPFRDDFAKIKKAVNTQVKFVEQVHFIEEDIRLGPYDVNIPAANLLEASIASVHAPRIWFPVPKLNSSKLMGSRFFRTASQVFSEFYGYDVQIESPLIKHREKHLLESHLKKGFHVESVKALLDCDKPSGTRSGVYPSHCGNCYPCVKKFFVLQSLNIEFNFDIHPQHGENIAKHYERYKAENEGSSFAEDSLRGTQESDSDSF